LYTTQNVLIRNNFNNKTTSHIYSSHPMAEIATVGTNTGHKWRARDTSDPSGKRFDIIDFPLLHWFGGCGKYIKARPTSTKIVTVNAM